MQSNKCDIDAGGAGVLVAPSAAVGVLVLLARAVWRWAKYPYAEVSRHRVSRQSRVLSGLDGVFRGSIR